MHLYSVKPRTIQVPPFRQGFTEQGDGGTDKKEKPYVKKDFAANGYCSSSKRTVKLKQHTVFPPITGLP